MPAYRVRFLNDLCDSTGHGRPCCQREIDVHAEDRESALVDARTRFEQLEGVSHWRLHADRVECEALADARVTARQSLQDTAAR